MACGSWWADPVCRAKGCVLTGMTIWTQTGENASTRRHQIPLRDMREIKQEDVVKSAREVEVPLDGAGRRTWLRST